MVSSPRKKSMEKTLGCISVLDAGSFDMIFNPGSRFTTWSFHWLHFFWRSKKDFQFQNRLRDMFFSQRLSESKGLPGGKTS